MGTTERLYAPAFLRVLAALVPLLCGLLGVFIANIPISLAGGLVPAPLLGLIPLYFWCLVRPDLMTPAAAFAIGLLQDVMSGAPPGVWTLGFVVAYAVVARQRDSFAGLSGFAAVLGFAAAALAASITATLAVLLLYSVTPSLGALGAELAMTVTAYIPGALLVSLLHHRLVGPLRSDF
ncbi:MAG: rod shape-determining protein MreD [Alphaproteobacteria bacterium]|nr:rod shape-determining protein MreD [Alphaproteobacteria bacterium]